MKSIPSDQSAMNQESPVRSLIRRFCVPICNDVMIVAHRGIGVNAPENSIAALESCISLGLEIVELDVRRTADQKLVIIHDATVDRTTNGSGRVEDLSLEELRRLRLRDDNVALDGPLTNELVPTLEEAVIAAKNRILINLDVKQDIVNDAYEVVRQLGSADQVIFKRRVTARDSPLGSTAPFNDMLLYMPVLVQKDGPVRPALRQHLSPTPPAVELVFRKMGFARRGVVLATNVGCRAWVNTVIPRFSAGLVDEQALRNPGNVWGTLIDMGFSIILTDEPVALRRYLKSRKNSRKAEH